MENTRNKPARRRLPLAVYLAFLLVAALAFTGASFASYKTVATGSDSARVARFVVTAAKSEGQSDQIELDCNTDTSVGYKFYVTNVIDERVSEVTTSYDVTVMLTQSLPEGVMVKLGNDTPTSVTGNAYLFKNVGKLSAGTGVNNEHVLSFVVTDDTRVGDMNITGITITVSAEQED